MKRGFSVTVAMSLLIITLVINFGLLKSYAVTFPADSLPVLTSDTCFTAELNGTQQVPPAATSASGTGSFQLDPSTHMLSYKIEFSGLTSAETGTHIHGPAAAGSNAPIIFVIPAPGSPKTGTVGPLTASQEADLIAGLWYVNIHSTIFPGGEIRGQLTQCNNLEIHKIATVSQNGFSIDEQVTNLKQVKIVEATLVEPNMTTIHAYHGIPKDVPATVAFSDPAWSPPVVLSDGKWELKLQLIATFEDSVTRELKNVEQKIIIQFDVINQLVSTPPGIGVVGFDKDIVLTPHPAQFKGQMDIKIGEQITGETKVFVTEAALVKPSGEIVSYTALPVNITTGATTIPFPGPGWVSSDGIAALDQAGMWQLNMVIIGSYQDGTLAIKRVNQVLFIDFNVIPESMVGTIALMVSSLGAFAAYRMIRSSGKADIAK